MDASLPFYPYPLALVLVVCVALYIGFKHSGGCSGSDESRSMPAR